MCLCHAHACVKSACVCLRVQMCLLAYSVFARMYMYMRKASLCIIMDRYEVK